jgi:glycosyltransferase involved in cell wall biosynthesis
MRIGVNLMFVVPGEVGASEPLATNLLRAMFDSVNEFVVYGTRGFGAAHRDIAKRAEVVEVPWSSSKQGLRIAAENSWLAIDAARRRLDLVHHWGGTAPRVRSVPAVVTIHDIQVFHYPENFAPLKRSWLRRSIPHAVRNSRQTIVPSDFVKRDLIATLGANPDRVTVIPFGSEALFGDDVVGAELARRRFHLTEPFFFYPARTYPHKNHRLLIRAYGPLSDDAQLILTGAAWRHDAEVKDEVVHAGLSGRVRHLGHVTRGELGGLYRAAAALVYPSRFEGFGGPVIEAMSVGCPVISSNETALPEVVSDAGILLDPDDEQGWAEAMRRMLQDHSWRKELSEKGLERAAKFSWKASADKLLSCYESAIGSR